MANGGFIGKEHKPVIVDAITTSFTSSGTFTAAPNTSEIQSLIIAGGGGGGHGERGAGGGGGAGGYRNSYASETSGGGGGTEATSIVSGGVSYPVVVGAAGVGRAYTPRREGSPGTDSSITLGSIDKYVKLLIQSDEVGNDTSFDDLSSSDHTITRSGALHEDITSFNAPRGIGTTSIAFDGSNDYLSIPDSDDWNFGSGDMTYEFRMRPTSVSGIHVIMGQYQSSSENMALYMNNGGLVWEDKTGGSHSGRQVATDSTSIMSTGNWYHVAVVKNGSNAKIYIDGIEEGSASFSAGTDFSGTFQIGAQNDGDAYAYSGQLENIRISKGKARYLDDFEPYDTAHGFKVISVGGGGGGGWNTPVGINGWPGGSGGGTGHLSANSNFAAAGIVGQGYAGGHNGPVSPWGGAGGGGASAVGTNKSGPQGEPGGDGLSSSITGSAVKRAGGGAGSADVSNPAGNYWGPTEWGAGQGDADAGDDFDAEANTGSGGGAGHSPRAGHGGSGLVVIHEPEVTTNSSGVWNLDDVYEYKTDGVW